MAALLAGAVAAVSVAATSVHQQSTTAALRTVDHARDDFVVRGVRLFTGTRVVAKSDVWIHDGRIKAIEPRVNAPDGVRVVDGSGRTLLPGLIDAHVHLARNALSDAALFGVTTLLDMFADISYVARIKQDHAEGRALGLADVRSAGTLVTAPKGHGTQFGLPIPTITSPDDAQAFVDARIAEGSDYIKIVYDGGKTYGLNWPTLNKDTLAAVVRASHERGKLAVAHIGSLEGARDAVEVGVDGLVHLFIDKSPDPDFAAFVARHRAFVVPTLSVLASITHVPARKRVIADARLRTYLSGDAITNLGRMFPRKSGELAFAQETVRELRRHGVRVLAGSDAPNPGTAHGASLHQELELLVEAGMTPPEALTAATSIPAAAFRLADRGEIAPGKRADLLLVEGDPTVEITATRNVVSVWTRGVEVDRAARLPAVNGSRR